MSQNQPPGSAGPAAMPVGRMRMSGSPAPIAPTASSDADEAVAHDPFAEHAHAPDHVAEAVSEGGGLGHDLGRAGERGPVREHDLHASIGEDVAVPVGPGTQTPTTPHRT